jgi:endonuclease III
MEPLNFKTVIDQLISAHGVPDPPYVTDPFEMILFENVSYLVSDEYRVLAYENLRNVVGLHPADILTANSGQWSRIAPMAGSNKRGQIDKLIRSAEIVQSDFDGDVTTVLKLPFKKGAAALKKFPAIGDPGAEKILLFGRAAAILPLESNGLRVMTRIGFAAEQANYTAMYRAAQRSVADDLPSDIDWLIAAFQRLRLHGQLICRRVDPRCGACDVRPMCAFGRNRSI